jgi:hypothetical protein
LLTVNPDRDVVERMLVGGELRCPECAAVLAPWGNVARRFVRHADGAEERISLRRAICSSRHDDGRRRTHVLLPAFLLGRRLDVVEPIWLVRRARQDGSGWRRLVALAGRAASTVRGWTGRAVARGPMIRARFAQLEYLLATAAGVDLARVEPAGGPLGDALARVGACLYAVGHDVVARTGVARTVSVLSGGWLLGSRPLPATHPGSNMFAHL